MNIFEQVQNKEEELRSQQQNVLVRDAEGIVHSISDNVIDPICIKIVEGNISKKELQRIFGEEKFELSKRNESLDLNFESQKIKTDKLTDIVVSGSIYIVCAQREENRTVKVKPPVLTSITNVERPLLLHNKNIGSTFDKKEIAQIRAYRGSQQGRVSLGRVRSSNAHKLPKLFAKYLPHPFVFPEHLSKEQLLARLLKTPANNRRTNMNHNDKKQVHVDAYHKVWTLPTSDVNVSADVALTCLSEEQKSVLQAELTKVLFRQDTTLNVPAIQAGICAEPLMIQRVLQHGLSLKHPKNNKWEVAKLRHTRHQDFAVSFDVPSLATRMDLTGEAVWEDGTVQRVNLEFKFVGEVVTNVENIKTEYYVQVQAQLRACAETHTGYLVQGHKENDETTGANCKFVSVCVPHDPVVCGWLEAYCPMAQALLRHLQPSLFEDGMSDQLTQAAVGITSQNRTSTKKGKGHECKGKFGRFTFHNGIEKKGPGSSLWTNKKAGVYYLGEFHLIHTGHKLKSRPPIPKVSKTTLAVFAQRARQSTLSATQLAVELDVPNHIASGIISRALKTTTTAPAHSLEAGLEELRLKPDVIYFARYAVVPRDDIDGSDNAIQEFDLLGFGAGSEFDVSKYRHDASGCLPWCWVEWLYTGKPTPVPKTILDCPAIACGSLPWKVPVTHVLRCEGFGWAFKPEAMRAAASAERVSGDATMCTSKGKYPCIRYVCSDANHKSIIMGNALLLHQSVACFRIFWKGFLRWSYGRVLGMTMMTICDGDENLRKISVEAAADEGRSKFGHAFGGCEFHALDSELFKAYSANLRFDGGVGWTLLAALRYMLRDSETQEEAEKQFSTITKWLSLPKPPPATKHQLNSAGAAALDADRPSVDVDDADVDITGTDLYKVRAYVDVDDLWILVRWDDNPKNNSWEPIEHMKKELGRQSHDEFMEEYNAQETPLGGSAIPGAKLGNDGSELASTSYVIESFVAKITSKKHVFYRTHWEGYTHISDTYECVEDLLKQIDVAVLAGLVRKFDLSRQQNPRFGEDLPPPDHTSDKVGGSNVGLTEHRRFILSKFAEKIWGQAEKLGYWNRNHVRHLYEATSGRVEASNKWLKYAADKHNGQLTRRLTKQSSVAEVVRVTRSEAESRAKTHQADSSNCATREPLQDSDNIPRELARSLTPYACKRLRSQMSESPNYRTKRLSSKGDDQVKWCVTRTHRKQDTTGLPVIKFQRKRFVSAVWTSTLTQLVCSCPFWNGMGIPCRHVLHVLVYVLRVILKLSDFDVRWWVEMYRAIPQVIANVLFGTGGIHSQSYMLPKGPRVEIADLQRVMMEESDSEDEDGQAYVIDCSEQESNHSSPPQNVTQRRRQPEKRKRQMETVKPKVYFSLQEKYNELQAEVAAHGEIGAKADTLFGILLREVKKGRKDQSHIISHGGKEVVVSAQRGESSKDHRFRKRGEKHN
eukprot:m.46118 g.46118  ORF g.46118 m.46118 type:complete len:1446 (-) comp20155_c0_seq1:228-4565(-)